MTDVKTMPFRLRNRVGRAVIHLMAAGWSVAVLFHHLSLLMAWQTAVVKCRVTGDKPECICAVGTDRCRDDHRYCKRNGANDCHRNLPWKAGFLGANWFLALGRAPHCWSTPLTLGAGIFHSGSIVPAGFVGAPQRLRPITEHLEFTVRDNKFDKARGATAAACRNNREASSFRPRCNTTSSGKV